MSFTWGIRIANNQPDSDSKSYKSFNYQGVQYSLFDCVYMYREGAKETDVGKLTKLWETKTGGKRGKVVWFFRPVDIFHYLRDYEPSWNELFMASGQGKGLSNIVPLEAIIGKCNVVCTSKDSRNNVPSASVLGKANYFFSHTFDVGDLRISDVFPDYIDSVKVERLFNWNQDKSKAPVECRTLLTAGARVKDEPTRNAANTVLEAPSTSKAPEECRTGLTTGARVKDEPTLSAENTVLQATTSEYFEHQTSKGQPLKKRKILVASEADSLGSSQDARKWFCKLPWEEREKEAHELGTLVHLINLDPSYASSDVEDIISSAFKLKADAKIVLNVPSFDSSYGQALVIFNSKADADFVRNELNKNCLIVEGRPLIARKSSLNEPGIASNFPGHLIIDKLSKIKSDKRKALSTSHCSQANTIEHEMAMQWRFLQSKNDLCWKTLHEDQVKQISNRPSLMIQNTQSDKDKAAETANPASESPVQQTPPATAS